MKHSKKDAYRYDTEAQKGWYYQLPEVDGGRSVIYSEVTGDHGQRIIGNRPRIYYIFQGEVSFVINGKKEKAKPGDVIIIPPNATYSYKAAGSSVELLLIMDLLDLTKLPPKKGLKVPLVQR